MIKFKIICLRVCFLLFMNAEFSKAASIAVENPNNSFLQMLKIDNFLVKQDENKDFAEVGSTHLIYLCIHNNDVHEMSFYIWNMPNTYATFRRSSIIVKNLLLKTIVFTAEVDSQTWYFQCTFSEPRQKTIDAMYSYLSLFSMKEAMQYRMTFLKAEIYEKNDHTSTPIIENINDLQSGKLYDANIKLGDESNKMFNITTADSNETHEEVRIAFSPGFFKIIRSDKKVVLTLKYFPNIFIIFYFNDEEAAENFTTRIVSHVDINVDELILAIPADVDSYLNGN